MADLSTLEAISTFEQDHPWPQSQPAVTLYEMLSKTADAHGSRNAITFQLLSGQSDPAETLSWRALHARVTQAANMLRALGVGPTDAVAYVLPNCNETAITLMAGAVAGIVNPINPLLDAEQIGAILRETGAKVVVTLKPFPKTDVAQKVNEAVGLAPNVEAVLEVDLLRYLSGVKKLIVPLIRPRNPARHRARVLDFAAECARQKRELAFVDAREDRVAAYFHTGGTTGMPKVAQHKYSGMMYNGWAGTTVLFSERDTIICPLPMFHVMAAEAVWMGAVTSGAHVVFPTPQGYRGEGVLDNFWKLVDRWKVTIVVTVPTAISAKMQRPVDADISSVRLAVSGSAPLPAELFRRFEKAAGIKIVEAYGLTEATCLVSCNPVEGEKKIGSIGLPFPHTDVKVIMQTPDGHRECDIDEVGEICIDNPGVIPGATYTEANRNRDLYYDVTFLRTGDLGRIDADGYIWITGRAKDLIIRGGHNIDPAEIEEALAGHEAVAFAGAIGQPDAFAGELPCVYVELVGGSTITEAELMDYASKHVHERAAVPKHLEILDELPKTAVGKVFKPDLRRLAITRVYNSALEQAGHAARVVDVTEDKKRGLVALIARNGEEDETGVAKVLGEYTRPWDWAQST